MDFLKIQRKFDILIVKNCNLVFEMQKKQSFSLENNAKICQFRSKTTPKIDKNI